MAYGYFQRTFSFALGSSSSFTILLERPASGAPATTFTWAADVAPYLGADEGVWVTLASESGSTRRAGDVRRSRLA